MGLAFSYYMNVIQAAAVHKARFRRVSACGGTPAARVSTMNRQLHWRV
jgi:hypothetical protein